MGCKMPTTNIGCWVSCFFLCTLGACSVTKPVDLRVLNNQYGDVRFSGSVPDGGHPIGKDLAVTVKLQNAGKGPIVIPDRWPISVSLFAEDSAGKGLVANPVVETMLAPSPPGMECEHMLRLEAGETVVAVKYVDVRTLGIETPGARVLNVM